METIWQGSFTADDQSALKALSLGQSQAIVAGDAKAYAELCCDDICLLLPGKDPVHGLETFQKLEERVFAEARFLSFDKTPITVEVSGELAVEVGLQEVKVKSAEQSKGYLASQQKYLHVFRKTKQGWKFSRLISNPSN